MLVGLFGELNLAVSAGIPVGEISFHLLIALIAREG